MPNIYVYDYVEIDLYSEGKMPDRKCGSRVGCGHSCSEHEDHWGPCNCRYGCNDSSFAKARRVGQDPDLSFAGTRQRAGSARLESIRLTSVVRDDGRTWYSPPAGTRKSVTVKPAVSSPHTNKESSKIEGSKYKL